MLRGRGSPDELARVASGPAVDPPCTWHVLGHVDGIFTYGSGNLGDRAPRCLPMLHSLIPAMLMVGAIAIFLAMLWADSRVH
jgi:hypothetical protein